MSSDAFPFSNASGRSFTRRSFLRLGLGTTALSLTSAQSLNASIYKGVEALNHRFPSQEAPDGAYWEALRRHYLFEEGHIHMNNGTVGPMPQPVFNTLTSSFQVQCTCPCDVYGYFGGMRDEVRRKAAGFLGADADEIALTRNTTEGMNFVVNGLEMEPGDEILMSDMEHPAGIHPSRLKAARYGAVIREVPLGLPPASVEEVVDAFERAITPRTKLILISHTVYISGLIAPVREITEMAHRHGVLVLADSAHGPGMLELDLHEMGADFFAASPYKWLGAPCGTGILYVQKDLQDRLWPTIANSGWDTRESAARFETLGQRADPLAFALGEAVDFQDRVGRDRIQRRIQSLATHLKEGLTEIPRVRLHTSMDPYLSGGLTAFSMEGVAPERIVEYLRERYDLVIRTIGREEKGTRGVRVSTHIFVFHEHVDMVLEGVRHLSAMA